MTSLRPCCSFTPEFKAEIVELCPWAGHSIGQIAKGFDLIATAMRHWVKRARGQRGRPTGADQQ
ncbi:transposase [Streptomyces albireticuli]|uniref:transposase n=1 Tax=Streptomyces albireticuli TaxID=1940 RepID=UPI001E2852EE|nr:transposase [Streptomyces albireticuli]MCD9166307.1 transposase [Streptomyces albireticuli]MCD9196636.1 transposase [Streptomyces albireticuli]